ncbi:MAG: ATP-dependent helicase UvrD/PcrA [Solirubrobacterales bacterium]|nr:ATP-dependent helicase UvrD/PcrA [Solirubrobacterales bacterium]
MFLFDLQGEFGTLTERRKLTRAFEAAWARVQTDDPGQPIPGLDQAFQDALLACLRWHRCMLVGEVVPISLSYLRHNPQADELSAYDFVLVDEYQDLNRAEQQVLDLLGARGALAVIGDDDQSIYGFKWANPEGIREFHEGHDPTHDVQLTICRRCPAEVVDMAQTLIERNPGRVRGPLEAHPDNPRAELAHVQWRSVSAEAEGIARYIASEVEAGAEPGHCLVLAPARIIGYEIRDAIQALGIPARSYFREEAAGSDSAREALTLLTLLADPDDRPALRTWIGLGSTRFLVGGYRRVRTAAEAAGLSVAEILPKVESGEVDVQYSAAVVERWGILQERLEELRELSDDPAAIIDQVLPDGEDELALMREIALEALEEAEGTNEVVSAVRYGVAQREVPIESEEVRVMSLHASKGLTAEVVVLAGTNEGLIPRIDTSLQPDEQQAQLEEQRRLFFVGMTRTRRALVFSTYSQLDTATAYRLQVARGVRRPGGFRVLASQFLDELGDGLPPAVRGEEWI